MFQYFAGNYVWNLSVMIAMESGGQIGEVDEMCRPLVELATQGDDAGTRAFFDSWTAMADKLVGLAHEDEALGRDLSASRKHERAALYYLVAERMQARDYEPRKTAYRACLDSFEAATRLGGVNRARVEIPYEGGHIAGYFVDAGPGAPVMVYVNGLDSTKELLYWSFLPRALLERGVSTLMIDQPGTGEALRLHGLTAVHDSERWASPVVDWLEQRPGVDLKRIGMAGISLGGYYAPRAVAFEPRFALGAVWGANHDWAEVQIRRAAREGDRPVPHYWDHVGWVWGASDQADFMEKAKAVTLDRVLDRVRVPFLVTHGENDRQIALEYAQKTYDALVNSPKRELKVFTPREGGIEHVSCDNMANARDFIADWIAETFATGKGVRAPKS